MYDIQYGQAKYEQVVSIGSGGICTAANKVERAKQVVDEMERMSASVSFLEEQFRVLMNGLRRVIPEVVETPKDCGPKSCSQLVQHAMEIKMLNDRISNISDGVRWLNDNIEI